jgi:membrane associated rhomboid family serine protease
VLLAVAVFLFFAVVDWKLPDLGANLLNLIALKPALVSHGMIWLVATYPFAPLGLFSELFALLSFWIFGAMLEDELGGRWLWEYFLLSTVCGGVLTSLLSYAAPGYAPFAPLNMGVGLWPAGLAVLLAFAHFHPEEQLRVYFIIPIKAKHLVVAYVLLYLVFAVTGGDQFGAVLALFVALSGYVYLRVSPRRGLRFAASEKWFGLRNEYQKSRRRRAGKKFAVYMKKQGEDVSIDADGRYVDPSGTPRDPNDKRWMN